MHFEVEEKLRLSNVLSLQLWEVGYGQFVPLPQMQEKLASVTNTSVLLQLNATTSCVIALLVCDVIPPY